MKSEVEVVGDIESIETLAAGVGVRVRRHLDRLHGKRRWRKRKGIAMVRLADGAIARAEVHWFEGHGAGRVDLKIKRLLPERP